MYVVCEGSQKVDNIDVDIYEVKTKVLICPNCDNYNVFQESFCIDISHLESQEDHQGNVEPEIYEGARYRQLICLHPQVGKQFKYTPPNIINSYMIAKRLSIIEPTACAVFVGRTLEFLCQDRKAKGNTLERMLTYLADNNEIPKIILDLANDLRYFRNIGAHASPLQISLKDAEILMAICEVIIEYVYEAPSMLKETQERIESLRKKG